MDKEQIAQLEESYRISGETICAHFRVDPHSGLNDSQITHLRQQYGLNRIPETQARSPFAILISQFIDFMVIMLVVAAIVAAFIGELADTITIVVIVILNAAIGFMQEWRAEKAITALKELAAPTALVRRNKQVVEVASDLLVPGDILLVNAGDLVAADIRLLEDANIRADESLLTGESVSVSKSAAIISAESPGISDLKNMLFKGSQITHGRGIGIVTATGLRTELGRIANLMQTEGPSKTPLQQRLAVLGRQLAIAVLTICLIIFVFGLLRGEPVVLMLLTAVSLAVAAIPEALPAVVSIALALGARKMVFKNALIRKLPAVESLGSVTYICSDKTGTLTLNQMQVEKFYLGTVWQSELTDLHSPNHLLNAMLLCNDADHSGADYIGDPTEVALLVAAESIGKTKQELITSMPRIQELPFDSARKSMSTLHPLADEYIVYCKGSPERILEICTQQLISGNIEALDRERHTRNAMEMAEKGYRLMGFAFRRLSQSPDKMDILTTECEMTLVGMVAMIDPARPEAKAAVAQCKMAGIVPVMITGDHASTAHAIATQLGICDHKDNVMTGAELAHMSDRELSDEVRDIRVYARVSPEQKTRIVEALQGHGEYVAMTGDGVNDGPSLRRANIGVAMGRKGTDVAREAADAILLDDNFATIVYAVSEGRRIYDNIRKFIKYTLTSNTGEIWTLFLSPLMGYPIPLLPIHILWINLVTDGLPGLALSFEKAEPNVMQRPPRKPDESIFDQGMWQHILIIGLLIGFLSIGVQVWAIEIGNTHWQTMTFTVLTFSQLVHALVIRSDYVSLFTQGIFSNSKLLNAVLLTVCLQLFIIYTPLMNNIFKTEALTASELLISFSLPLLVLVFVEIEKILIRSGKIYVTNRKSRVV